MVRPSVSDGREFWVLEKHRDTDSDTESATSTEAVAAKSEELALPAKSEITGLTFL